MKTKKQKYDIEKMIADGYCRVSNRHRMVARIDRGDWQAVMAKDHAPWDPAGQGMDWVRGMGLASAADHYRRCYSKDKVQFESHEDELFRRFANSGYADAPSAFAGRDQSLKENKVLAAVSAAEHPVEHPVEQGDQHREEELEFGLWDNQKSMWIAFVVFFGSLAALGITERLIN